MKASVKSVGAINLIVGLKSPTAIVTIRRTDWTYEPARDLLTQVKNTAFGSVVSQYDYVNDTSVAAPR